MIVEIDQNCNNNIITCTFKNPNLIPLLDFAYVYVRNRIRFVTTINTRHQKTTINTHHHSYQVVELFFRRLEYLKAKNRARLVLVHIFQLVLVLQLKNTFVTTRSTLS